MSLPELAHALQETGWATALRESAMVYPLILITHLTCIAIFGGMIFVTNLRLFGAAFRQVSMAEVIAKLRPWKHAGLFIMVTCGVLLASSKADEYYPNPYIRLKLLLLTGTALHAVAFRRSVYRNPEPSPGAARAAAICSTILWLAILSLGRWIAYYEPPKT